MSTEVIPIELPTGRRSYIDTSVAVDIHDPNWIPVLDGGRYKPPISPTEKEVNVSPPTATFSLFPSQPGSPKPRPTISHAYSKSSLAPESVKSDSDSKSQSGQDHIEPLPSIGGSSHPFQDATKGHNRQTTATTTASSEEKISVGTEGPAEMASTPNTEDTASILGSQSGSQHGVMQEIAEAMVISSVRSSLTSTTKVKAVPTSKYNRKPVGSIASATFMRPDRVSSMPQSPVDSPRLTASSPALPAPLPKAQPLPPPPEPVQKEYSPRLNAAKSSASERRQRALHSHPSNISLRSRRNSSSDDAELVPKVPSVRKPRKSTASESRPTTPRSTIYDSQVPTPAPTTPLPSLPPDAHLISRRPSTRDEHLHQKFIMPPDEKPMPPPMSHAPSYAPSHAPSLHSAQPSEHVAMTSFMSQKNSIVLRRFDDVHVRLLLCLQDEISQLERELMELENPTSAGSTSSKMIGKTRILRELRKVVAEYDHLFNTWSKMQANKMAESTKQELRRWLSQKEPRSDGSYGINTQQDLRWLDNTYDLSSVQLGKDESVTEDAPSIRKEKPTIQPPDDAGRSNSGGNGFMALFGCAGKRK